MSHAYLTLKLSWDMFGKGPDQLAMDESERLRKVALRQQVIEQHILASPESQGVVITPDMLAQRLDEIRSRYAEPEDYRHDLTRAGLDDFSLSAAVDRDLRIETILERIAAAVPSVSLTDAEIYYRLHPEAFDRPPARKLRHILITFDDAKGRAQASAQLETLRQSLRTAEDFAAAALRYSQCPSAMEGGQLGTVRPGQLFAQIDPVAFALAAGEISEIIESPIGLHIVRCDEILESGLLAFDSIAPEIVDRLTEQRRSQAQRHWIKQLVGAPRPI